MAGNTPIELYGHYLSIIEKTDPHGTCSKTLATELSHGIIYKGYKGRMD